MRKLLTVVILALAAGWVLRAQISAASPSVAAIPSTALAANCPLPTIGFTIYCQAADAYQVSQNGAKYVVIWPAAPVAAGVIDVSVNGVLQTGHVVVPPIPTKATSSTTTTIQ